MGQVWASLGGGGPALGSISHFGVFSSRIRFGRSVLGGGVVRGAPPSWDPGFFQVYNPPRMANRPFQAALVALSRSPWARPRAPWGQSSTPQVPPVHLSESVFESGATLDAARKRARLYVKAIVKRKAGSCLGEARPPAPRKRRRVKSYVTLMGLNNMLVHASGRRLADYCLPEDETGEIRGSPFSWPGLSVATDSGPDCVSSSVASHFVGQSSFPLLLFVLLDLRGGSFPVSWRLGPSLIQHPPPSMGDHRSLGWLSSS